LDWTARNTSWIVNVWIVASSTTTPLGVKFEPYVEVVISYVQRMREPLIRPYLILSIVNPFRRVEPHGSIPAARIADKARESG